jgi:phage gpG-like protein
VSAVTIQFTPWNDFHARMDKSTVHDWLDDIGKASVQAFRNGMSGHYPPSSAPGAWPHNRTGDLRKSIKHEVSGDVLTVGTQEIYAVYLRYGTSRMARRKMSDNALQEGIAKSGGIKSRWVQWTRS